MERDVPSLPAIHALHLVELVERRQVAATRLLDGLGLAREELAEPHRRVPLTVVEELVERARSLTGEPALGVLLGMRMRISWHGFLGFAAMTAGTVREALDLATRYASTRTSAIGLALYVEGDTASLVIEERTPLGALRELVVIAVLVGIWQLGQALTGGPLDGVAECAFEEPAFARTLPHGGRLRFARPAHRLVFPASTLELRFASADPVATRLAIEQCERELSAVVDAGLASRIRGLLSTRTDYPSVGALARELHMSERTLKRKLADRWELRA